MAPKKRYSILILAEKRQLFCFKFLFPISCLLFFSGELRLLLHVEIST